MYKLLCQQEIIIISTGNNLIPGDDLVNKSRIWLFKSILCYSWLITFSFKGNQNAHYFIFLKL